MKNATIATSRTRATDEQLIDYRPLPAEWGDLAALHAVRAERARGAVPRPEGSRRRPRGRWSAGRR